MRRLTGSSPRLFKFCTPGVVAIGIVLTCASTSSAQDRLFALLGVQVGSISPQQYLIEVDTRPGSLGEIRKALPVPSRGSNESPVAIGGGRYLVWLSAEGRDLHIFDTLTEQASMAAGFLPSGSKIVAADSARLRVFVQADGNVVILDGRSSSVRSISIAHPPLGHAAAYAPSANRLFVSTWTPPPNASEIAVLNVETGVVEKTLAVPRMSISALAVDDDGSRLFVAAGPSLLAEDAQGLFVFEPQSGGLLAHYPSAAAIAFQLDRSRRRMLAAVSDNAVPPSQLGLHVAAFDLDTATLVGSINGGSSPWASEGTLGPFQALTGPRSPLYVFDPSLDPRRRCERAHLQMHDPDNGAPLTRTQVSELWGTVTGTPVCNAHLTLLSPPPPSTLQNPMVYGSRVTLSWTPSYDALHYDLEAGSAPGLRDLVVSGGHTNTSLSVNGVPPGRYFLRVRAINSVGRSIPSNEVEVVVP